MKPLKMKKKEKDSEDNGKTNHGEREIPIDSVEDNTKNESELKEKEVEENNPTDADDETVDLEKEVLKFKELAARKTAELDNMMKRTLKEKNELIEYGNAGLFNRLLPLMDDFAKAIDAGRNSNDYDSLLKGIEMIYQKAQKTFEDAGVKKMVINEGDAFDVNFHEALMQIPNDSIDEGKIIQVAQDGYMFKDRVLQHAKVVISAGKSNN